jgi:hypothetical protein
MAAKKPSSCRQALYKAEIQPKIELFVLFERHRVSQDDEQI